MVNHLSWDICRNQADWEDGPAERLGSMQGVLLHLVGLMVAAQTAQVGVPVYMALVL
jgi:hypothetical protein